MFLTKREELRHRSLAFGVWAERPVAKHLTDGLDSLEIAITLYLFPIFFFFFLFFSFPLLLLFTRRRSAI